MQGADNRSESDGFSLAELLVGFVVLFLILGGTVMVSKNASTSTPQSRDLSDKSSRLSDFVDSIRNHHSLNPGTLPITTQQMRVSLNPADTVHWRVYSDASPAPNAQPAGLLLLSARLTWFKQGRVHAVETSTFLNNQ